MAKPEKTTTTEKNLPVFSMPKIRIPEGKTGKDYEAMIPANGGKGHADDVPPHTRQTIRTTATSLIASGHRDFLIRYSGTHKFAFVECYSHDIAEAMRQGGGTPVSPDVAARFESSSPNAKTGRYQIFGIFHAGS